MNLSWSARVIKYILFGFNFIFVLTGIIILVTGVSVKGYYYNYDTFLDEKYFSLPNLLIAIGSIIFFISIFGCLGAKRESWLLTLIFACLLVLIFILEFAGGISGYVLKGDTAEYLQSKLTDSIKKYTENNTEIQTMWDLIQRQFVCCGAHNYTDWKEYLYTSDDNKNFLPISCCEPYTGMTHFECTSNSSLWNETTIYGKVYQTGCVEGFGNFIKAHATTLGAIGLVFAAIQLMGIIFAFYLSKQLKHAYYST